MVKFLVAKFPKGMSLSQPVSIPGTIHQLRKALQWLGWGGTSCPAPMLLPVLPALRGGAGSPIPTDINMASDINSDHGLPHGLWW